MRPAKKILFLSCSVVFVACAALLLTTCDGSGSSSTDEANNTPSAWRTTVFAGSKDNLSGDGVGTAAGFQSLCYITLSGNTLYTMDHGPHTLRSIDKNTAQVRTPVKGIPVTSSFTTIGGGSHADGSGDGTAKFNTPCGIAAADATTLYVADAHNNRIRKITLGATTAATQVTTIAGSTQRGKTNGVGTTAEFYFPQDIAIIGNTLYVTDSGNHLIRKITIGPTAATTQVTTFAGSTQGYANGVGTAAKFENPRGIVVSGNTLYVTDKVGIRTINIATQEVGDLNAKLNAGDIKTGDIAVNKTGTTLYALSAFNATNRQALIYAINIATKVARAIGKVTNELNRNVTSGIAVSGDTLYVSTRGLIYKLEYR